MICILGPTKLVILNKKVTLATLVDPSDMNAPTFACPLRFLIKGQSPFVYQIHGSPVIVVLTVGSLHSFERLQYFIL